MKLARRYLTLSASVLSAALLLAACGGGDPEPPPDTVAPTVAITDDVTAATATGPVTFSFDFSEDVGSSFVVEDVAVVGAAAGTLVKVSATQYTLVVTPADDTAGTISVSVAAAKFKDLSNNDNVAQASATQAFDTTVVVPPPGGGALVASFDETTPLDLGAFGDAAPSIAEPPPGGTGAALKLDRSGGMNFGGTFFTVPQAIPFAADRKTVTARVYATRANAKLFLKVEVPGGGPATEVAATTGAANSWQTLSWALSGVNPANSYTVVVFSAETDVAGLGAQTYWIDEVTLAPAATLPPPLPGGLIASFDETPPLDLGAFGDAGPSIAEPPAGGTGSALKLTRSGGMNFGGTFFTVAPAIPFAADRKTVTARVYATRANAKVFLKVEVPGGGPATEVSATTAAANSWQTLSWVLSGVDPAGSYSVVVFSADTDVAGLGEQTYWIDEVTLAAASGSGGSPLLFSSGFGANNLTVEGGGFGGFSGSNQDDFNCSGDPAFCGSGGDFAPSTAADASRFFYYYQTPTPATAMYMGIYVLAPGVAAPNDTGDTPGVQIDGQSSLKFKLAQNPEWFGSATNNFMIVMDLGKLYTAGGGCRLQLRAVVTPTAAADTDYTVPLSAFELVQNCAGVVANAAAALAASPIMQVAFQGVGGTIALMAGGKTSGANLTVPAGTAPNVVYPTTLAISGGIRFE